MEERKFRRTHRLKAAALVMSAVLAMGSLAGCKDKEALENQQAYRQVGMNKLSEGSYEEAVEAFQKALDQSKAVVKKKKKYKKKKKKFYFFIKILNKFFK